jgi:hypothetical protein
VKLESRQHLDDLKIQVIPVVLVIASKRFQAPIPYISLWTKESYLSISSHLNNQVLDFNAGVNDFLRRTTYIMKKLQIISFLKYEELFFRSLCLITIRRSSPCTAF